MNYRATLFPLQLVALLALLAGCSSSPTQAPTAEAEEPQPGAQLLAVRLTSDSEHYSATNGKLQLTAVNNSSDAIYLPICGPWEIISVEDPDRPVWAGICEVDFLGHELVPGEEFVDTLLVSLPAGTYQARVRAFGQCNLKEPDLLSDTETFYGPFDACGISQQDFSPKFEVE